MKLFWQKTLAQLTWTGLLGLFFLGLGLIINVLLVQPLANSLDEIRHRNSEVQKKMVFGQESTLRQAGLAQFYALFQPSSSITDELAKIYTIAEGYGVELRQARYKLLTGEDSKLMRYQMSMRVEGEYGRARNFALHTLKEIPTLALDSIRFERQSAAVGTVDTEIILTLYVMKP